MAFSLISISIPRTHSECEEKNAEQSEGPAMSVGVREKSVRKVAASHR
jgi:hypothetical protein